MLTADATLATAPLTTVLGAGVVLVSYWKPILPLLLLIPWARIVSGIYDKHAAQFHLPRRTWNVIHLLSAAIALALFFAMGAFMPDSEGAFWVGWGAMLVILCADLYAYAHIANKDDRVPDRFKIKLNMAKLSEAREAKKAAKMQAKVALLIKAQDAKGKYTKVLEPPQAETPEYELRSIAEKMYEAGLTARASELTVGPGGGKDGLYQVAYLVDGVRQPGDNLPPANAAKLMDFWKMAAGLDVADRRRKQAANISVEEGTTKHIVRVSSIGAQGGMRLTMLFDPEQAVTRKAQDLGLLEVQMKELKEIVADGKGVVLLGTPPDGGRTTLMYSVLRMHDSYRTNVQTVEIEPQAPLEGVRTNKYDPAADVPGAAVGGGGAEFSTTVRSILRRDPDVVAIAELPDANTAKEIARADHERTRSYLSFRAGDPIVAIQAYVKFVGEPKPAAETLHGVIIGKLLRKLCTNCRVPYQPSAEMLKKLGLPEGKVQQLFKKGGQVLIKNKPEVCPVCGGGGYLGQEGVFEICSINKDDQMLIAAQNFQGLRTAFRKRNLPSLQHVAIRKAVDGITSVEEVMRITTTEKPPGAPTSGSPGPGAGGADGVKPAPQPA